MLYLYYFPVHLKYQHTIPLPSSNETYGALNGSHADREDGTERVDVRGKPMKPRLTTTPEWRLAMTLCFVVALHLYVSHYLSSDDPLNHYSVLLTLLSLTFLLTLPQSSPPHPLLRYLATFLGLSATLLAILQYAPQIHKTYSSGLVGALSIGTMAIQVPGSVLFVLSLVFRPGTDWTSWLAYAVTGLMQGALLVSR